MLGNAMTDARNVRPIFCRTATATPSRTTTGDNEFRLGEWLVEPDLNRLRRDNRDVRLSPLAMDILSYLAHPPGRVVSADELVRELWGGRVVSDNPVYKIVTKLRRALDDDAENPRYIETVRKRGYRLVAPVTDQPRNGAAAPGPNLRRSTDRLGRTIGVMPVCAIGDHSGLAEYCDGLAEEIMVQVTMIGGVRVVTADMLDVELDMSVQATARIHDSRLRVTVRLVQPDGAGQLWANAYERRIDGSVDSQVSIAREVAHAVRETTP